MKEYHAKIEGMGCAHCVKRVTEALAGVGAAVTRVEIGSADFSFDGEAKAAAEAIEECGFDVTDLTEA